MPPVGSPCAMITQAIPSPSAPPMTAIAHDSTSTSVRIKPSLNPSVFSTASSLVRSRIDCAMALPATNRMKNITIDAIAIMIAPMSPT